MRPFVLLRDGAGNQAADLDESVLQFKWFRGQKRICSLQRCAGGAKIQCMQCLKLKKPSHLTFFCSVEHFRQAWPRHQQLHNMAGVSLGVWHNDDGDPESCVSSDDPVKLQCRFPPPLANIWAEVSNQKRYTPLGDDVGRMLRLEVSLLKSISSTETSSVLPEPEAPPPRQMVYATEMAPTPGSVFRTFSYNILADMYATRQRYPYCPLWSLLWTYRRNNILRELLNSKADLISLQEVQLEHFENFLYPKLKEAGYEGLFKKKTRASFNETATATQMDGCAIFYKEERFALMEQYSIEYNEAARQHIDQQVARNSQRLGGPRSAHASHYRSELSRRLLKGNIALVVVLEEIGYDASRRNRARRKRRLCVANSHIFWDPEYNDVKLWQTMVLCQELEKLVLARNLPLIICGDFNSTVSSAVYQFLCQGQLRSDHNVFEIDTHGILPPPTSITHRLPLASAYGEIIGEPKYTNYTGHFVGCLDYIWFTKTHLRAVGVLREDDEAILQEYTALPSPRYPSDHIPLVGEFEWI